MSKKKNDRSSYSEWGDEYDRYSNERERDMKRKEARKNKGRAYEVDDDESSYRRKR